MASQTVVQQQPAAETVDIWITDLIEADYVARGVFPAVRRPLANSESGAKRRYTVTRAEAQAIYEDAEKMRRQRRCGKVGKGLSLAYCATASRLWECRAKDETANPPPQKTDVAQLVQSMRDSELRGCALPLGTRILHFGPGGDDEVGQPGVISEGYGYHKVSNCEGSFTGVDGERFDWRPGYCVDLDAEGKTYFVPAYTVTLDDCKPTHLRLVHSA